MAQAFITVNNKTYRKFDIDRRKPKLPIDKFSQSLPEGDIWIIRKSLEEQSKEGGGGGLEEANKSIKRMYRNRLWTVYQTSYCRDMISKEAGTPQSVGSFENALLESSSKLYGPRTQKIAPPLPTARKLMGYMRPENMYIPLTTYQFSYGKLGYQVLNGDFLSQNKEADQEQTKTPEQKKQKEDKRGESPPKKEKQETYCPCVC